MAGLTAEQAYGLSQSEIKKVASGFDHAERTGDNTFSIFFVDGSKIDLTIPLPKDGEPGAKGDDGIGISKIEKIGTVGLVDTYRITFTDNSTFDYEVKNGADGQGGTGGSGEENTIESISVNGVNVSPDENKNVDITVPDAYDDTDIRTELANKADATAIPSKVSELTNDSNYQTAEQVNSAVTTEIAKVVADAPEDLNTLKEMSDWIAGHEDDASAMNSAISDNKTAITALQTGKADKSEIPTTLPADGGNSDTVNNHTVKSDVPTDAVFTDTVYDDTEVKESISELNESLSVIGKCKNLLNPTLQTTTQNGVTCTNNGDGTYTIDTGGSPATGNTIFTLSTFIFNANTKYKLIGCPSGGSNSTYRLDTAGINSDIGNGSDVQFTQDATYDIRIDIASGTVCDNLIFKPMITTNLNATYDDFVPYTGEGKTLTHDVAELKNDLSTKLNVFKDENSVETFEIPTPRNYGTVIVLTAYDIFSLIYESNGTVKHQKITSFYENKSISSASFSNTDRKITITFNNQMWSGIKAIFQ